MSKKKKSGPETPEDLYELQLAKETDAAEQRNAFEEIQEEERAIELGLTQTLSGKKIKRHGSAQVGTDSLGTIFGGVDRSQKGTVIEDVAVLLMAGAALNAPLTGQFGTKAVQKAELKDIIDKDGYRYDTAEVSEEVYRKLREESEEITQKMEELQGVTDPKVRAALQKAIAEQAEQFHMRLHPVTHQYVHDLARVEEEERTLNPQQLQAAAHIVAVYYLNEAINDSRKIRTKLADQYDQNPTETVGAPKGPEMHNV